MKVFTNIKKKHLDALIGWYTITKRDTVDIFKAKFHKSDVPKEEKHPDFFIDKTNKLKIWYTPFMAKTQHSKRAYENWTINFDYLVGVDHIHNFIISPYYPKEDFQPVTKKLLKDPIFREKLREYLVNLIYTQISYYDQYRRIFSFSSRKTIRKSVILVPKDYNSIFWFPKDPKNEFRISSFFDFEPVVGFNKKTELILFCDEALFSWNIVTDVTIQFKTKEDLKKYLTLKGQRCIRF